MESDLGESWCIGRPEKTISFSNQFWLAGKWSDLAYLTRSRDMRGPQKRKRKENFEYNVKVPPNKSKSANSHEWLQRQNLRTDQSVHSTSFSAFSWAMLIIIDCIQILHPLVTTPFHWRPRCEIVPEWPKVCPRNTIHDWCRRDWYIDSGGQCFAILST